MLMRRFLVREIAGALPQAAIATLIDLDFAAEDGVLFGHQIQH